MLKQDLRRFAPFGLYLAGLALLVTAGLLIIERAFNLPVQISTAVVVVGLALYVLLNPQGAREALTGRQARYGSNALVLTMAFIGILVVINYVVYQNTQRWDLTEDKSNTLAPETIQTLTSLTDPIRAEAYYTTRFPLGAAGDLLENYKLNSKGNFDYEVIDPEAEPIRAQQANVTRDGTIVLLAGDRQEQVSFASEQELTAAIIRLANPGTRAVYFLVGHGEYDIEGNNTDRSYTGVKDSLLAKNYAVSSLNLLSSSEIPADALAIVIAGPTKPLSDQETELLKAYLDAGGAVMYLPEPRPVTDFGDAPDPLALYLETIWGIKLGDDVVIDLDNAQQPLVAIANQFGTHPITEKMYTLAVLLPTARSVQVAGSGPEGVTFTTLASTAERAWGETDFASIESNNVTIDEDVDLAGPVPLAVSAVNNATQGRVVVIGDADFANSQNVQLYGNSDFILNSIDWAAEQENLISLTARTPTERFLALPQRYTMGLILLGSVFLLPGLVLIMGISVWLQRRRQG